MPDLFKTTIVIWTDYDPINAEIEDLARDATTGDSYCSKQHVEHVANPAADPDWDGTTFFEDNEDVSESEKQAVNPHD